MLTVFVFCPLDLNLPLNGKLMLVQEALVFISDLQSGETQKLRVKQLVKCWSQFIRPSRLHIERVLPFSFPNERDS